MLQCAIVLAAGVIYSEGDSSSYNKQAEPGGSPLERR